MLYKIVVLGLMAAALGVAALPPGGAAAKQFMVLTDLSQESSHLGSVYDPLVVNGSEVQVLWQQDSGDLRTRDSSDGGQTFGEPQDTTQYWSNYFPGALGDSREARVGENIYQSWFTFGGGGTFFRRSDDGGQTWKAPVTLSNFSFALPPSTSANGDHVFVAWDDAGELKAAASLDGGKTLQAAADLGQRDGAFQALALPNGGVTVLEANLDGSITLQTFPDGDFTATPVVETMHVGESAYPPQARLVLTPSGSEILLWTWAKDDQSATTETIGYAYSNDNGLNWSSPEILDHVDNFESIAFAAGDNSWLFAWRHDATGSDPEVEADVLYDSGTEDSGLLALQSGRSSLLQVAATGDEGFVSWTAFSPQSKSLTLAVLPRGETPSVATAAVPAWSQPGAMVAAGSEAGAAVDVVYFGRDPDTQATRLYFTRVAITGSTDCSGTIGAADVLSALRTAAGAGGDGACAGAADVNCDGAVTGADALLIAEHVAGLPEDVPAGCSAIGT